MEHPPVSPRPGVVPIRRRPPVASVQGTLALDLQPRHEPPRWPVRAPGPTGPWPT